MAVEEIKGSGDSESADGSPYRLRNFFCACVVRNPQLICFSFVFWWSALYPCFFSFGFALSEVPSYDIVLGLFL